MKIAAPATINNGINKLSQKELVSCVKTYEEADVDILKFVPASGAASRMFKNLFSFLESFDGTRENFASIIREEKKIGRFFTELDEFAFYDELNEEINRKQGISIEEAKGQYKHDLIVDMLLQKEGLNYATLPKGLLPFHKYEDHVRTATQEHLAEGLAYAEKKGEVHIHFTISPEHRQIFEKHIAESIKREKTSIEISASFSEQQVSTDIIASTISLDPFREAKGNLLFRPAGHGALLENLNQSSADVIFIKNIDNVVPDHLRGETIKYKKALAGLLLTYQQKAFALLRKKDDGKHIEQQGIELLQKMGIKGSFSMKEMIELLNRPIRVCGMVKNEGKPGGGPFWVKREKSESLQIIESAQIDKSHSNQLALFKSGAHFNPVDIVCGVKNCRGEKFDLLNYRDEETGFISEKSHNGKRLLAMELPGLWNGGMANWNTIFVEVPLITFNPVKTVTDLLKPTHR